MEMVENFLSVLEMVYFNREHRDKALQAPIESCLNGPLWGGSSGTCDRMASASSRTDFVSCQGDSVTRWSLAFRILRPNFKIDEPRG